MSNENTEERPDLSEQYQDAKQYLAYLRGQKEVCWSKKAHENLDREIAEYEAEINRLSQEILRSDKMFMAANNNFAGNSEFPAMG